MDLRRMYATVKPRAFSGPFLQAAARLDAAQPGFLLSLLYGSSMKRQAIFAVLATIDLDDPQAMLDRLEGASDVLGCAETLDHSARLARALVVSRAKRIVEMAYGSCPDGYLGLLARLGPEPVEPNVYETAFRFFASPKNPARAKVLGQLAGRLSAEKILILERLDGVLVHRAVVDRLFDATTQVDGLVAFVAMLRKLCDATDAEITESLDQIPTSDRDLRPWARRWARRMRRLPVTPPIPETAPEFEVLFGSALETHGRQFQNCAGDFVNRVLMGRNLLYQHHNGGNRLVIVLEALSGGRWVVADIRGPRNAYPERRETEEVRARLAEYGVLYPRTLPMESKPLAGLRHLLDVYDMPFINGPDAEGEPALSLLESTCGAEAA